MPPKLASASETTGLKWPPETGPNMRMIANSPAAVAVAFSNSWSPTSPGESCSAAMPDPITSAARNAEPKSSASRRRGRGGLRRSPIGSKATRRSRREHQLVGELARQPDFAHLQRDGLRVVADTLDPRLDAITRRAEHGERASRIAVLGLADRAAVDEQHAAILVDPRLVGVAEDQHP